MYRLGAIRFLTASLLLVVSALAAANKTSAYDYAIPAVLKAKKLAAALQHGEYDGQCKFLGYGIWTMTELPQFGAISPDTVQLQDPFGENKCGSNYAALDYTMIQPGHLEDTFSATWTSPDGKTQIPYSVNIFNTPTTSTYYVVSGTLHHMTLDQWMYKQGVAEGQSLAALGPISPSDAPAVVLDFGDPRVWPAGCTTDCVYGTTGYHSNCASCLSAAEIQEAVIQYMDGYTAGLAGANIYLSIIVGTNNHFPKSYNSQMLQAHGYAWFKLVASLTHNNIFVIPGLDIEPGYSSPSQTVDWENGYCNGMCENGIWFLNFGSADGCPVHGASAAPGRCNNGWTQDDILKVSVGITNGGGVFPEIYSSNSSMAKQWQQILEYYEFAGAYSQPTLFGVLTQQGACKQVQNTNHPCDPTLRNSPAEGWAQLWYTVNSVVNFGFDNGSFVPHASSDVSWRQ